MMTRQRICRATQLLMKLAMVLGFLGGHTGILPAAAALLAAIDGGHAVELHQTSRGAAIVLRHVRVAGQCPHDRPPGHEHAPISQALAALTIQPPGHHSDHVLAFGNDTADAARAPLHLLQTAGALLPPATANYWTLAKTAARQRPGLWCPPAVPVCGSPGLTGLRTTVMVI